MKEVVLLHNPKAGDEEHSKKDIISLIEANGYKCRYSSTKKDDWKEFDANVDLIIVAGGDGTVRKVVKELFGRKKLKKAPPFAVLPLGTANNISKALNNNSSVENIVKSWNDAEAKNYDLGIIEGIADTDFFLESFGFGLFPAFVSRVQEKKIDDQETPEEALTAVLQALHEFIFACEVRKCTLLLDGTDYSGEYLLAEVMNINSFGPNLNLAPSADSSDGKLDVVLIAEKDKEQFATYVLNKIKGGEKAAAFPSLQAETITISWDGTEAHVDDTLITLTPFTEIKIKVKAGLLEFLK